MRDTQKALDYGLETLRRRGEQDVKLPRVVWFLLEEAADTLRRMPDPERVWLAAGDRISWPQVVHTVEEREAAEWQRILDLKEAPSLSRLPRLAISDPTAVSRMLTVLGWLRFVRGKKAQRDKRVVLAKALGQSQRVVRKIMGGDKGDSAANMVKVKVINHICQGLLNLSN